MTSIELFEGLDFDGNLKVGEIDEAIDGFKIANDPITSLFGNRFKNAIVQMLLRYFWHYSIWFLKKNLCVIKRQDQNHFVRCLSIDNYWF